MIISDCGIKAASQLQNLPTNDRCFNYGDGCFTTILVKDAQPALLPQHIQRLQSACDVLAITGMDWSALEAHLSTIGHNQQSAEHQSSVELESLVVCKVLISRGQGGRGYAPTQSLAPHVYISYGAYPAHYLQQHQTGLTLGVSSVRLGSNPLLAGIKHCNRLEQVMVKQRLSADNLLDVDDVLVADRQDCVVEASASNLFYHLDGQWYTPPIDNAGVQGVMRDEVMRQAASAQLSITERKLGLSELIDVEAMVLTNALMIAVAVQSCSFQDCHFQTQELKLNFALANQFASVYRDKLLNGSKGVLHE